MALCARATKCCCCCCSCSLYIGEYERPNIINSRSSNSHNSNSATNRAQKNCSIISDRFALVRPEIFALFFSLSFCLYSPALDLVGSLFRYDRIHYLKIIRIPIQLKIVRCECDIIGNMCYAAKCILSVPGN